MNQGIVRLPGNEFLNNPHWRERHLLAQIGVDYGILSVDRLFEMFDDALVKKRIKKRLFQW